VGSSVSDSSVEPLVVIYLGNARLPAFGPLK